MNSPQISTTGTANQDYDIMFDDRDDLEFEPNFDMFQNPLYSEHGSPEKLFEEINRSLSYGNQTSSDYEGIRSILSDFERMAVESDHPSGSGQNDSVCPEDTETPENIIIDKSPSILGLSQPSGSVNTPTEIFTPSPTKKTSSVDSTGEESKCSSWKPSKVSQVGMTASEQSKVDKKVAQLEESCKDLVEEYMQYDFGDQITRALYHSDYTQASRLIEEVKTGRHETDRSITKDGVASLLRHHMNHKILTKDQRSDAKTTSIIRHIKKLPDVILKKIGSKCQYKSGELDMVLRQYLRCFKEGYLKFFTLDQGEDIVKHFLDFIVLAFPEKKVFSILTVLERQDFLLQHQLDSKAIKSQVVIRKDSSKRALVNLYSNNCCLQYISNMLCSSDS